MSDETAITKWRDRANAAVRSLVALQERYDQVLTENDALRPLRAAALRYGAAELRCRQSGMPPSAEDVTAIQEEYEAHTALVALALALAAEEGKG